MYKSQKCLLYVLIIGYRTYKEDHKNRKSGTINHIDLWASILTVKFKLPVSNVRSNSKNKKSNTIYDI